MKKILALALLVGVYASLNAGGAGSKAIAVTKDAYKVTCTDRDGRVDPVRMVASAVVVKWAYQHVPVYYQEGAKFYKPTFGYRK